MGRSEPHQKQTQTVLLRPPLLPPTLRVGRRGSSRLSNRVPLGRRRVRSARGRLVRPNYKLRPDDRVKPRRLVRPIDQPQHPLNAQPPKKILPPRTPVLTQPNYE